MKVFVCAVCMVAFAGSVSSAQAPAGDGGFAGYAALFQESPPPQAAAAPLTLDDVEKIALARSPQISVAARLVAVAEAHVPVAGALDDPMAMYRGWGIPLHQPWNFNDAQNMFSISQTFSGAGKRSLRSSVAQSDVDLAKAQLDEVRLDVRVRVHKAFDDLLLAQNEMQIHHQHVAIARQAIEAARIQYTVGKGPQQDMLKAQVALTSLAEHMIRFDHDAALAQARLNTLLGRDPETPVRVAGEFAVVDALPQARTLDNMALQTRPDLMAAEQAAARSHIEQTLAKKAYVPDFTVSGGYMLMPAGSSTRNDYMVEASINLPWLNRRKHDAEIAEATARTTEQDAELSALRNVAFGQIQDALVEAQAAQKLAHVYHDQLRPQAEATLESSVIAYENDKTSFLDLLDSQMTVINVDLTWLAAVADFDTRLADLELATGAPLEPSTIPAAEVRP
ncbi:MAG: TolC family protein [Acidobacteriaceae bacterium]|jgi:cobalt-zinc-cadmium efflux system outer membrane protein